LAEAVKKSLDYRLANNYNAQGWSLGWVACMMARLKEGDRALNLMEGEFFNKVYPNMFVNAHERVQVGDMMGTSLAMIELLLQSHAKRIELLPALPKEWSDGKVTGLCTRGGFVLDFAWKDCKLLSTRVFSRQGGECTLHYGDKLVKLDTEAEKTYQIKF
jgi:alpha-L-fucosidase 2